MRHPLTVLTLLALAGFSWSTPTLAAPAYTLYVSTQGDNGWSGTLAEPNMEGTDGPLASVRAARDRLRQWRASQPGANRPVTVLIRGGIYELTEPLVLEPQDSGTAAAPVTYAAYPGEAPVLSGGRRITGWRTQGNRWECTLPEVQSGRWYFRQLFVNGQRRQPARSPNTGYFRIADPKPALRNAAGEVLPEGRWGFECQPGDLSSWSRLEDAHIVLMHSWETSFHPIQSIDAATRLVRFTAPLKEWWTIGYWEKAQRYYVENLPEALDSPGEWYLNRTTGVLTYCPLPGERLEDARIIAPRLTELLHLQGNPDQDRWVEHVTLRGLKFHHADWVLSPQGNSSTQAAVETPAALLADGTRHTRIDQCEVAHVGTYAIWFRRGCQDGHILQNRLFDLGAGGIRVGETTMAETDAAESTRNLVDNNHIFDGGHVYAAGVGIWVAQSSHNRISHNEIHDLRYSGLSIGWNWNDAPNRCHHNLIEYNHAHHLVHGVLSDAGAIYTLGASPGSVIRNNLFHDVWPYQQPPFGWGIYLDATCSGYRVESNLVYHTQSGGLMFNNGGHQHIIENNIFADSAQFAIWPYWEKRPNTFQRNIVRLTQGDLFVTWAENTLQQRRGAGESLGVWDHNLYWHTEGAEALRFFRHTFPEWQALGLDTHSLVADPHFQDPASGDYRLPPDSPAWQIGFQPLNLAAAGLHGDPAWIAEAQRITHPPTLLPAPPPPPPPLEVKDDFEETKVGSAPAHATVDGEAQGATIRITDEQACQGRHSLKITDAAALTPAWQPHFFYQPHLRHGRVRQSFDIWLAPESRLFTEWRDEKDYPQNIGPSLAFAEGGQVTVAGQNLLTIPTRQWVRFQCEAALGKGAPRTFTLTVTVPGQPERTFEALPFAGSQFEQLHWLGFSSTAAANTACYLDNLTIEWLK